MLSAVATNDGNPDGMAVMLGTDTEGAPRELQSGACRIAGSFWLPLALALALGADLTAKGGDSLGSGTVDVWVSVTRGDTFPAKVSGDCDTAFGGSTAVAAAVTADVAIAADFVRPWPPFEAVFPR